MDGQGSPPRFPVFLDRRSPCGCFGRTSPRSFLTALREAAADSEERYPSHVTALHYESIKRGVQRASGDRVEELEEDYPWIKELMAPLRGLVVPCRFEDVERLWEGAGTVARLESESSANGYLPPEHVEAGPRGLRGDLENVGLFQRLTDDRVNIPDLFRVGLGIGRRGGVKAVRRE